MSERGVLALVDGAQIAGWRARVIGALREHGASVDVVARPCACPDATGGTVGRLTRALARSVPLLQPVGVPLMTSRPAGAGELVLDLRSCAPHPDAGRVWYVRLGDDAGPAPFVRAIAAGERSVTVELRESGPDGERCVDRARYRVQYGYAATLAAALRDAAELPARALGREPALPASPAPPPPAAPRLGDLARFGWQNVAVFAGVMFEYFFLDAVWNVGVLDISPAALVAGAEARATWWPERGGHAFVADPIVARRGDAVVMLVEAYDPRIGRGTIAAVPLDGSEPPRDVITRSEHLSYPFVVEHDGELYCIPENHANGVGVPVYRCLEFPDRWEFDRFMTPAPDVLDPTIFAHEGRWWLCGTRRGADPNAQLFAWYGPTPLGPWTAHARTPILTDASAGRPAGPVFRSGGHLYRPAQDSSRSYGGALAIARIDELTPEIYRETIVRRLEPLGGRYRRGIHTLCADGEQAYVDGKRYVFSPAKAVRVLTARLRRR